MAGTMKGILHDAFISNNITPLPAAEKNFAVRFGFWGCMKSLTDSAGFREFVPKGQYLDPPASTLVVPHIDSYLSSPDFADATDDQKSNYFQPMIIVAKIMAIFITSGFRRKMIRKNSSRDRSVRAP